MDASLIDTAELVSRLDLVAVFALFILAGSVALARDWIVTGNRVKDLRAAHERETDELHDRLAEMRADRDYWRAAALRVVGAAEQLAPDRR